MLSIKFDSLTLFIFVVKVGVGLGSQSAFQRNQYAQSTSGLKKSVEASMKGESRLAKTLSLVQTKEYVVAAKDKLHFRPTLSGPSSMAMAASEAGVKDIGYSSAEALMKHNMQFKYNFVMDPREMTKTHDTAEGPRAGNNSAGVTFYHPDYDPDQPIDPLRGSFRKLTRVEQEEHLRKVLPTGVFEQWKASKYYDQWLGRSEALFEGGSGLPINSDSEYEEDASSVSFIVLYLLVICEVYTARYNIHAHTYYYLSLHVHITQKKKGVAAAAAAAAAKSRVSSKTKSTATAKSSSAKSRVSSKAKSTAKSTDKENNKQSSKLFRKPTYTSLSLSGESDLDEYEPPTHAKRPRPLKYVDDACDDDGFCVSDPKPKTDEKKMMKKKRKSPYDDDDEEFEP